MTNREEAILGLKELRDWEGLPYCIEEPMQREGVVVITQEVIDFAIEVLEQTELTPSYNSIKTELDCVSRQAVLDYAKDTCLNLDKYEDTEVFCDEIKALPSVTPKAKVGHWIYTPKRRLIDETDEGCVYITDYRCSCSECGGDFGFQKMSDAYCKYCGAKMEVQE